MRMKSTIMLLGLVVLLTACSDSNEVDASLSADCQAGFEEYEKTTPAPTDVGPEMYSEIKRQMYVDKHSECKRFLPAAQP